MAVMWENLEDAEVFQHARAVAVEQLRATVDHFDHDAGGDEKGNRSAGMFFHRGNLDGIYAHIPKLEIFYCTKFAREPRALCNHSRRAHHNNFFHWKETSPPHPSRMMYPSARPFQQHLHTSRTSQLTHVNLAAVASVVSRRNNG